MDSLKQIYLSCGRRSVAGRLPSADVMQCSLVYEALKRRAFGGDFERLLAWSRANAAAAAAAP